MKKFEFTLIKKGEKLFTEEAWKKFNKETQERVKDTVAEEYSVSLPHNCGEWIITETPDKEVAIKEMVEFIQAAKLTLVELVES